MGILPGCHGVEDSVGVSRSRPPVLAGGGCATQKEVEGAETQCGMVLEKTRLLVGTVSGRSLLQEAVGGDDKAGGDHELA